MRIGYSGFVCGRGVRCIGDEFRRIYVLKWGDDTKIIDWLGRIFKPPESGIYRLDSYRAEAEEKVAIEAYALFAAVHLIANLLSGCEFRTFRGGRELHGEQWAALNIRPNRSQNAAEWKTELISRLLLSGEVLCVQTADAQLLIAESFCRDAYALYGDRFSQVSRADFTFQRTFAAEDVLYLTSGVSARAAWMQSVMAMYERLLRSAADRFQKAGGERGILKISAVERGQNDFSEKFDKLMNEYFKGYFGSRNAVLPLFDGYEYAPQPVTGTGTYTNDLTAVKTLTDEAIGRAAQVFGIPPSYIRGDAAGIRDAQSAMLTNCVKPIAAQLSAELTAKLHTVDEIASGSRITVDTGCILHHDLIADSQGADKLIGAGWTLNEVRRAFGAHELDAPEADTRFITKNYGTLAEALEGGEGNADTERAENGV